MNYENLFNISWVLLICSSLLCFFGVVISFKCYGGDCRTEPKLFNYLMRSVCWVWIASVVAVFVFGLLMLGKNS